MERAVVDGRFYTVTAYVLQQIQLLAHWDRHGVAMQASTRTLVNVW
jgi:hypothetical protein